MGDANDLTPAVRDVALTVVLLDGEYHWVLLEAVEAADEDLLSYEPVDSSERGYASYS